MQTKDFVITSFEEGNYFIPSLKFVINKDSNLWVETNPLPLKVRTVEVDTTADFKDIRPPFHEPLNFEDFVTYIWFAVGLAAIALILFFVRKYIRNKREIEKLAMLGKSPHELALYLLDKLKKDKIWKKNNESTKEHHSKVSEIVRTYIESSQGINAMEMTTSDILQNIEQRNINIQSKVILKNVLHLTDMVKFAKENPSELQNEVVVDDAVRFIKYTMPISQKEEPEKQA
jgi:hypothetical protein